MISLTLTGELEERLKAAAGESETTAPEIVARAVEHYLELREIRLNSARAAAAEADKGYFVSQAKMHAWMDSWGTADELPLPEADITPGKPNA